MGRDLRKAGAARTPLEGGEPELRDGRRGAERRWAERPALRCLGGGEGAVPGPPARRCPRRPLPRPGRTRPDPTGAAERATRRRPVTGRGTAPQEVSSGSWVKAPGQERAPCAGSGRGLRQALVSLSRFSNPSAPFCGERRALGPERRGGELGRGPRRGGLPPARGRTTLPPSALGDAGSPLRRRRLARFRERGGGRAVGACGRAGAGAAVPAAPGGPREQGQRARPLVAIAGGGGERRGRRRCAVSGDSNGAGGAKARLPRSARLFP